MIRKMLLFALALFSVMSASAAQNQLFKAEVDRIFADCGSRQNPFSADLAVQFAYGG